MYRVMIDLDQFENLLRERLEKQAEQFRLDMPNAACRLGYNEATNIALRVARSLARELGT